MKYYLGRKFLLTVASLIAVIVMAVLGKLTADVGLALAVVLGFYNGANVAQKYVDTRRENARFRRMEREDEYNYYDDYDYNDRRY